MAFGGQLEKHLYLPSRISKVSGVYGGVVTDGEEGTPGVYRASRGRIGETREAENQMIQKGVQGSSEGEFHEEKKCGCVFSIS